VYVYGRDNHGNFRAGNDLTTVVRGETLHMHRDYVANLSAPATEIFNPAPNVSSPAMPTATPAATTAPPPAATTAPARP
jgi:hypothetical protein